MIEHFPAKLAIELQGRTVRLELVCPDDYAAIALHDQIIAEARAGGILLAVQTTRVED